MRLLTAGDERLFEGTADCLATVETQVTLPLAEVEQLVGPWRSQPLKRDRQRVGVKLLADTRGRMWVRRQTLRHRHLDRRNAFARRRAQPAIGVPLHGLNRRLAA